MGHSKWMEGNKDLFDERMMGVVADGRMPPKDEKCLCLLCLKGNRLDVYHANLRQQVGRQLYSVNLAEVTNVKSSRFFLHTYLKFDYQGRTHKYTNFPSPGKFLRMFRESCG